MRNSPLLHVSPHRQSERLPQTTSQTLPGFRPRRGLSHKIGCLLGNQYPIATIRTIWIRLPKRHTPQPHCKQGVCRLMYKHIKMVGASLLVATIFGGLPMVNVRAVTAPTSIPDEKKQPIPAILERISQCESGGKQFKEDGKVVRGPDGHDIGLFQIRETVHGSEAKKLGFDIYTEAGNTAYALVLFARNGTRDWSSSVRCWSR